MPRVSKNPEERKNEILDAAQLLYGTKGYQQTSVSDIVKQIGVAQGTFYYYFKSKEEAADALIERHLHAILGPMKEIVMSDSRTGLQKLASLLLHELDEENGHSDVFQYLHHENNTALHQRMVVQMVKQAAPMLASLLEQGNREGTFRVEQPQLVAEFMLTGFQFWLDPSVFQWNDEERSHRVRKVLQIFETLLGAPQDSLSLDRLKQTAYPSDET
ncbi:TetR/AcrR family transcriptional regulator [Paenibacillus turpanensis]|uniref:TetR/AcrR family transcriptional regulator n=1 Tax=Paenibacillus turpanensis TaxID=2689078 RepID=UPI00140E3493|nr:TetR/AcrR family transcriptional regulator [Paenibacillus turpanensis]